MDDQEIVREGVQTMLNRQDCFSVVGEAATVTDAFAESSAFNRM